MVMDPGTNESLGVEFCRCWFGKTEPRLRSVEGNVFRIKMLEQSLVVEVLLEAK